MWLVHLWAIRNSLSTVFLSVANQKTLQM